MQLALRIWGLTDAGGVYVKTFVGYDLFFVV